jgi:peptide chain release factor subunit 1
VRPTLNQRRTISDETVRALAAHVGDPAVSSVYLDTDGARRPIRAQVEAAFEQLADNLTAQARAHGNRILAEAVEGDLGRMRDWLQSGWDRSNMRGLALFSASRQEWFEVVPLAWPVADAAGLGPRPRIAPLVAGLDAHRPLLVALIDRRRLRLFDVEEGNPSELPGLADLEARAVDTDVEVGGFGHQHEEAARVHYRRAAERIKTVLATRLPSQWVVGGPDEAVAGLQAYLRPATSDRLAGRVSVRVTAPLSEITEAVREAEESVKLQRQTNIIRTLEESAGPGQASSIGLDATLRALDDRRVGTLLVAEGFATQGARCPACGHLGANMWRCPRCGTTPAGVDDIVELAVEEAVAQHAAVEFVAAGGLDRFGAIAAIDRF